MNERSFREPRVPPHSVLGTAVGEEELQVPIETPLSVGAEHENDQWDVQRNGNGTFNAMINGTFNAMINMMDGWMAPTDGKLPSH